MSKRLWVLVLALVAYTVFIIVFAIRPTTAHRPYEVPTGASYRSVAVSCGAPWGNGAYRGPSTTVYPIAGKPCGDHAQLRVMSMVDVFIGLAGIGLVVAWAARRTAVDDLTVVP